MQRLLAALGFLACANAAQGCELIADFDRSKIPGPDASIEAGVRAVDAGNEDAGDDDGGESPVVAVDAGLDASADAGADAGTDASTGDDAGNDDGGA